MKTMKTVKKTTKKTNMWYKFLNLDGKAPFGKGKWHLPSSDKPGKWMPVLDSVVMCRRGYHVCRPKSVLRWIRPDCYEAEVDGYSDHQKEKSVFSKARLLRKTPFNKKAFRLLALDALVLKAKRTKIYKNVLKCVAVQKAYVFGLITRGQMKAYLNTHCVNNPYENSNICCDLYAVMTDMDLHDTSSETLREAACRNINMHGGRKSEKEMIAIALRYIEGKVDLEKMEKSFQSLKRLPV